MKGILRKYFIETKKSAVAFAICGVIFFFYIFVMKENYEPMLNIAFAIVHFALIRTEHTNKWEQFAAALPNSRKDIVKARYIYCILTQATVLAFNLLCSIFIGIYNGSLDPANVILYCFGGLFTGLILSGSLVLTALGIGNGFGIKALLPLSMLFSVLPPLLLDREKMWILPIFGAAAVILFYAAYRFTVRLYENKDLT